MRLNDSKVIVAGHICLDIIPEVPTLKSLQSLSPGELIDLGRAHMALGGVVSNTGIALQKLGVKTKLVGKIGDDDFGKITMMRLKQIDDELTHSLVISTNEHTSYSLIFELPQVDRIIFHYPGTNDSFHEDDVKDDVFKDAMLFHFGYPTIMKSMYQHHGESLRRLLLKAKNHGLLTTLDMALPDPNSLAVSIDWQLLLKNVLPYVDFFLPSIEEMLLLLHPEQHSRLKRKAKNQSIISVITEEDVRSLADELLALGCKGVVLKLGEKGLYIKTSNKMANVLEDKQDWNSRELWSPCYEAVVKGTTGAGDCTIAGFINGLTKGLPVEKVLNGATAVGAISVESIDATSEMIHWREVEERIRDGWKKQSTNLSFSQSWKWDEQTQLWFGPDDRKGDMKFASFSGGLSPG